ncbi:PqiB family protein [uncultured Cedecea sp.]|uniref:PqiB family protein n=1 Tax=uncultured Cedecea sp. TaxID=988762 RepID=UPI00262253B8|nr:PqiB family protein [uncultured Cedecea sp.]
MPQDTPASVMEARIKTKRRISPFWLLPFIALLIGGWLMWTAWQEQGATVTIDFTSANGIVAGRTPVRYQGVEVGMVKSISLNDDLRKIEVKVSIKSDMQDALREETQFWLVTPKASLAGVSGLDALVGGNYIGMMPGGGSPQDHFTALDTQPKYRLDNGELLIHLQAPDLGSLNSGSLVYYRKIPVGRVYDYEIDKTKQGVAIDVLIDKRFANLVKTNSRFWNVSGVKADISLSGAQVQLESLAALVNGAIAFDSPDDSPKANSNDNFTLFEDLAHSQRGVNITLSLPGGNGLNAGSTKLMYQGLEVGSLTQMTLNPDSSVTGELVIDPSVVNLMRTGTRITLEQPKVSLNNPALSRLLTGATLELIPGEGEPQHHFTVLPGAESPLQQPNVLTLTLTAPESYGIDVGQPLILRGVQVGQIIERTLSDKGVSFVITIDPQYRALIQGDSKFVVNSRFDVKVGIDGVEMLGASTSEWLSGGIRILPGSKGEVKTTYPLFANLEKARENSLTPQPTTTLTLTASSLPDIQTGSVVLYRKFEVGSIISVRPLEDNFEINVHIKPEYRHLLTSGSVFWAEGGAKVQLNGSGLSVQAVPLSRALKGAISFDNLKGAGEGVAKNGKRILFASETAARAVGSQILLRTFDAGKLSVGMPIRYLGINIGQLDSMELGQSRKEVVAKAVLYPEYVTAFSKGGSRFSVVTPQISAAGVDNLDTIIQPYINAEPGTGNSQRVFELQAASISDSRYADGLSIVLEVPEAGALNIGTPVLFRGIEVGTVAGMKLGELSDRVLLNLRVSTRYQHLVRDSSVFWLASGYTLDFGLTGGVVKTGTFNQFIRGGIAFATPPGVPLAPRSKAGKHFLLEENEPKEWRQWGTALPR